MLLNGLLCSKGMTEQHVLKEPIALDCGDCICKSCIPNDASFEIKCSKCGEINQKDLKDAKPLKILEDIIEKSLKELSLELEKQTSENIARLKSLTTTNNETIEISVKYIEEEIEIRVESLKIELDKLFEGFKSKLAALAKEIKEQRTSNIRLDGMKPKDYEDKLNELRNYLEKEKLNKEKFYQHQDVLKSLKKDIKQLESNFKDLHLEFTPSNKNLAETLIGEIGFQTSKQTPTPKEMKEIFEKKTFETIPVNGRSFDSLVLNDNQLLLSNGYLEFYDDHFNLVKTIGRFDNKSICTNGMAYDDKKSRIFISDYVNHQIIMTDLNLNFIKSFGSKGNDNQSFNQPYGLVFKDNHLYVCDFFNKRIQILDSDLHYVDTIKLDYGSVTIKISSKTIGICTNGGTYFYGLETKMVKVQYPGITGRMNFIGSHFYVISYSPKKVCYVYDTNGSLVDEINIDSFINSITSMWDASITILKNNLLVVFQSQKQILKFKIRD